MLTQGEMEILCHVMGNFKGYFLFYSLLFCSNRLGILARAAVFGTAQYLSKIFTKERMRNPESSFT